MNLLIIGKEISVHQMNPISWQWAKKPRQNYDAAFSHFSVHGYILQSFLVPSSFVKLCLMSCCNCIDKIYVNILMCVRPLLLPPTLKIAPRALVTQSCRCNRGVNAETGYFQSWLHLSVTSETWRERGKQVVYRTLESAWSRSESGRSEVWMV